MKTCSSHEREEVLWFLVKYRHGTCVCHSVAEFGVPVHGVQDAIKEGDGIHVLRCYRYLLPILKSSRKKLLRGSTTAVR